MFMPASTILFAILLENMLHDIRKQVCTLFLFTSLSQIVHTVSISSNLFTFLLLSQYYVSFTPHTLQNMQKKRQIQETFGLEANIFPSTTACQPRYTANPNVSTVSVIFQENHRIQ